MHFLLAASSQQSDDGASVEVVVLTESLLAPCPLLLEKGIHLVCRRVAHVVHRVVVLLVERDLEGQDAEHGIHIALDVLDAPLLPCPYLRRDVVIDGDVAVLLQEACYLQVEAGIVHQDDHIRLPSEDVFLTLPHASQDSPKVHEHREDSHIGKVAVVTDEFGTFSRHHVAAEATELCLSIFLSYCSNEVTRMKVTACLACYEIVLHVMSEELRVKS